MRRRISRSFLLLPLLIGATPLLLGMGTTGGRDVSNPARDFQAMLVDIDGVKVEANRVNIGGDVQLEGDMGRGTLRIAFDNIDHVEFSADSQSYCKATVHLKTGESVSLRVRSSLMIYGHTNVGVYQVRARDLQSIAFKS
jgi:hypothetical protein